MNPNPEIFHLNSSGSSVTMSYSIKNWLKNARSSIEAKDPDLAVEYCDDILEDEPDNYYALLFKGKACNMMNKNKDAMKAYKKACKLQPDDINVWKGMLKVSSTETDYEEFFTDVLGLAQAMQKQNLNLRPCVDYIDKYMSRFKTASYQLDLNVYYYYHIIPGKSELGDLVGAMVQSPTTSLSKLIDAETKREATRSSKEVSKLKMSLPRHLSAQDTKKIDDLLWSYYENSNIPELYEQIINTEIDDQKRLTYEDNYLKYKYNMLLAAPKEEKPHLYAEVYEMASGMVLVGAKSSFAYETYFDWTDPEQLGDLDLKYITGYINSYGIKGLGSVLYALIMSDSSPFDVKQAYGYLKPKRRRRKKKVKKEKDEPKDDREGGESKEDSSPKEEDQKTDKEETDKPSVHTISAPEVLDLMLTGIQTNKESILGYRIFINYCLHAKEYQYALDYSQTFVRLILKHNRATGTQLPHARLDSILDLAIIYTYHESPKNFPKAMELYNSVLKADPDNIQAKIGEGLIFMENHHYDKAAAFFKDVVEDNPENVNALQEYGWCLIKLGKYSEGRQYTTRALELATGTDASSMQLKSLVLWHLGQSYLLELDQFKETDPTDKVKKAYGYLISSLKVSTTFAPCYTSLGDIYLNYYGNENKAFKCYYKAFDLDPSELPASRQLAKHFSTNSDWEMVTVICERVVDNERARKLLVNKDTLDPSWPYRMAASAAMERQDDIKAIEYYQEALRISPTNVECWTGLGEAYLGRGRLEASKKVFSRVLEIDPDHWQATYLLAVSLASMMEYSEAIELLKKLEQPCANTALYETLIMKAQYEARIGFIGRSRQSTLDAIDSLSKASQADAPSQKLWKSLADVLNLCVSVQSHTSHIPFDVVEQILSRVQGEVPFIINEVNEEESGLEYETDVDKCHHYAVEAAKAAIRGLPPNSVKMLRAGLMFNLGVEYSLWFEESGNTSLRDCAIMLLKKAVQLESDNAEFWSALGVAALTRNAKVSQHCFIKASSLDPHNTSVWINLGCLYLFYGDYELANESFVRVQSMAPAESVSWEGQALTADALGEKEKAKNLYTHSYVLSNGKQPLAALLYGLSVTGRLVGKSYSSNLDSVQEFNSANFGLFNYLKFYPSDKLALELAITVIERIHAFEQGQELSEKLCSLLEDGIENGKDLLLPYAEAKAQLARLQLGAKKFGPAIESASVASELLSDTDSLTEVSQKCLLSCLTVIGLASYFTEDYDRSLEEFNKILEVFPDSRRVVVLVAQVLYAFGEEDTKQAAVEELLGNIEKYGSSLLVALTVASISIVDDLAEYLPAVKDELEESSIEARISDSAAQIPFFIEQINNLIGKHEQVWQRQAFLFPSEVEVWKHLSTPAAVNVAVHSKQVDAATLSAAYLEQGSLREIQRALFLDPSNREGYEYLRGCL